MSVSSPSHDRRLLGVGLRCCSATAFAVMGALLKVASLNGASLDELVFYRSIAALIPVTVSIMTQGGLDAIRMLSPASHATRSAIGLLSMVLTFGALALLPLAQATTISYSAPIGATILSALMLGERVGPRRWLAVLVGFMGVLLVANPFGEHVPTFGLLVGLSASLAQATTMVTLRQISGSETTTSIVFWFTVATSAAAALFMPFYGHLHDSLTMGLLICAGLVGGLAQIVMTSSLRFAPVSVVVPFDYLQMVWATLIGWFVLASPSSPTMLAGAALIVASGLYTAYRERMRGHAPAQALAVPEA